MRRAGKFVLVAGVVATLGATGTVFAYAGGWTLPDNPAAFTAKVATMPRGIEPSVAKQSGQAVVAWSAQEIAPGVRMDHYSVTAHSVSDPPRPDVTHTVAAGGGSTESIIFAASEVAGGRWRWTIVPRLRQWIGAESRPSRRLTFPAAPVGRAATAPADPADPAAPVAPEPAPAATTSRGRSPDPATTSPGRSPAPAATGDEPETVTPEQTTTAPEPLTSASGVVELPPAGQ
jgi:hypothetical protein